MRRIVETSTRDYVFFMVDDLIFRDGFSQRMIERFMDANRDVDSFSLRLGRNIRDDVEPKFSPQDSEVLVWETSRRLGRSWKYFWELDSSTYRRDLVWKYLQKFDPRKVSFPNPLEQYYYSCMPTFARGGPRIKQLAVEARFIFANKVNRIACFTRSKCFSQGVNLVAARNIDYDTKFDTLELHRKMEEGYLIDHESLKGFENTKPNVGSAHFRLVRTVGNSEPGS